MVHSEFRIHPTPNAIHIPIPALTHILPAPFLLSFTYKQPGSTIHSGTAHKLPSISINTTIFGNNIASTALLERIASVVPI